MVFGSQPTTRESTHLCTHLGPQPVSATCKNLRFHHLGAETGFSPHQSLAAVMRHNGNIDTYWLNILLQPRAHTKPQVLPITHLLNTSLLWPWAP